MALKVKLAIPVRVYKVRGIFVLGTAKAAAEGENTYNIGCCLEFNQKILRGRFDQSTNCSGKFLHPITGTNVNQFLMLEAHNNA